MMKTQTYNCIIQVFILCVGTNRTHSAMLICVPVIIHWFWFL